MTQKSTSKGRIDRNGKTEEEFLRLYDSGKYPKPSLTADICIFQNDAVLLIERGGHPYLGCWALPGGFANANEPLEKTAQRELLEETGLSLHDLHLAGIFSKPGRDPRGWTVSAAYWADVTGCTMRPKAADDAASLGWFTIQSTSPLLLQKDQIVLHEEDLAFDHADILKKAIAQRSEQ